MSDNVNDNMKSKAHHLHEFLSGQPNGYEFYSSHLEQHMAEKGIEVSSGGATGFLARAIQKGMVERVGRHGWKTLYRMVDRTVTWRFNPPSKGSNKGKTNSGGPRVKVPQLPIGIENTEPVKIESLFMRIFDLAAEVEKLEKKPLSSFSTDDLLQEIKRRMT